MDKKQLGQRIKTARKGKGLTGEKLAEACHIHTTYLRQMETGVKIPSLPMFVTLCHELDVTPNYLLADVFADTAGSGMDELLTLWEKATPEQLKMIKGMIKVALDGMNN